MRKLEIPLCAHYMTLNVRYLQHVRVRYVGSGTDLKLMVSQDRKPKMERMTNFLIVLKLWPHQQMYNATIFVLLRSYMFRHCRYHQVTYTKISLNHAVIHNLQ